MTRTTATLLGIGVLLTATACQATNLTRRAVSGPGAGSTRHVAAATATALMTSGVTESPAPPAAPRHAGEGATAVTAAAPLEVGGTVFAPGIETAVVPYADCTGRAPLSRSTAAVDICVGSRLYFIAHNPGPFTPLLGLAPGAPITWLDAAGDPHRWRVVAVRTAPNTAMPLPPVASDVVAQLQTCVSWDGSVDRVVDVAPVVAGDAP